MLIEINFFFAHLYGARLSSAEACRKDMDAAICAWPRRASQCHGCLYDRAPAQEMLFLHQQLVGWTWLAWQEVCTQTKELSPKAHCCQRGQENNFLI